MIRTRQQMAAALGRFIGARLAQERERRNWSAANLARRVPCDREQVRQWEDGVLPTLANLYGLALALECSVFDLLPRSEELLRL